MKKSFLESIKDQSNTEILDEILKQQTKILSDLEKKFYRRYLNENRLNILSCLDIGCGNGAYSKELESIISGASIYGIDNNLEMINIAKSRNINSNINYRECDYLSDDSIDDKFDLIHARAVLQHLSLERREIFFEKINNNTKSGSVVFIGETDDSFLHWFPENNLMSKFKNSLNIMAETGGGDRYLGRKIGAKLSEIGFCNISRIPVFAPVETDFEKQNLYELMIMLVTLLKRTNHTFNMDDELNNFKDWLFHPKSAFHMCIYLTAAIKK